MIGDGTVITGDIKSKGDIRVDGSLKGSIDTEGKVSEIKESPTNRSVPEGLAGSSSAGQNF